MNLVERWVHWCSARPALVLALTLAGMILSVAAALVTALTTHPKRICDERAGVCLQRHQDCETSVRTVVSSKGVPSVETEVHCGDAYWRVETP